MVAKKRWLKSKWNPRIALKQSIVNFPYLWDTYNELAYLCSGPIMTSSNILRGRRAKGPKGFYSVTFQTRQLHCLLEIYDLFYVVVDGKKNKVIKKELLFYMDYIVLAHWIMGDGSKRNKGVTLCTDGFTYQEVILLIEILRLKFDIMPRIHKEKTFHRIAINKYDLDRLRPHLIPHFVNHFLYKIN